MIRATSLDEQRAMLAFVEKAAKSFSKEPRQCTYGTMEPGSWLAIRWGLMDRGVMVVKLSDDFEPRNFVDAVQS